MIILVTAFEPFGGSDRNSSLETLRALPESHQHCTIHKAELPVVYDRCAEVLEQVIREVCPDAVLCLGQAEGRDAVTPEYAALNVDYATAADNAGQIRTLTKIIPDGPDAYFATLPIERITAALREHHIPSRISFTAGTYVCNNLMYHLLHNTVNTNIQAGFVHLPLSYDNGKGTPYLTPETLQNALLTMIETIKN